MLVTRIQARRPPSQLPALLPAPIDGAFSLLPGGWCISPRIAYVAPPALVWGLPRKSGESISPRTSRGYRRGAGFGKKTLPEVQTACVDVGAGFPGLFCSCSLSGVDRIWGVYRPGGNGLDELSSYFALPHGSLHDALFTVPIYIRSVGVHRSS